jgi:hypothetical protein
MREGSPVSVSAGVAVPMETGEVSRRPQMGLAIWQGLTSPWLLLVLAVLLALLALLAFVLPQLPGQLQNEAGATERWLNSTAASYGAAGTLLRNLGLFDILHSPLFQGVLAVAAFVLLLQIAQLVRVAYHFQRVPEVLDIAGTVNGEPLPVATGTLLLRWRRAYAEAPLPVTKDLQRLLDARLHRVDRRTVRVAAAPAVLAAAEGENPEPAVDGVTLEERLLAQRGLRAVLLQPLLALGMLLALLLIWLNSAFGWEFTPPMLAPGESASDAVHNVRFEYVMTEPGPSMIGPVLRTTVGDQTAVLPLAEEMRTTLGNVELRASPGWPALLVRTPDGAPLLARPGQVTPVASIGLGFPGVGSEETLLLPQQGVGLRIVRLEAGASGPAEDAFLVEVYQSESEMAVARFTVAASEILAIPAGGAEVSLAFVPLPGLSIQVRQAPGLWLIWPALALIVAGALGFWQRPGFILAQIGPWPVDRSIITVQSDLRSEMSSLRRWYAEQQQTTEVSDG